MTKQSQGTQPAVQRTSAGLRDAIFDELDAIRTGTSNPTRANAVAKLAGSIVETVRMEIEVQKFARSTPAGNSAVAAIETPLGKALPLGG